MRGFDTMSRVKKKTKLLTPIEVGERLGVTPRTITRWCREEKIKAFKLGRVWRIPESSVDALIWEGLA